MLRQLLHPVREEENVGELVKRQEGQHGQIERRRVLAKCNVFFCSCEGAAAGSATRCFFSTQLSMSEGRGSNGNTKTL
jgi:hypothetical protein